MREPFSYFLPVSFNIFPKNMRLFSHNEHFRVAGRTTFYESVEQMQNDLDAYRDYYNTQRAHRGKSTDGRTPKNVFFAGILLSDLQEGA